MRVLESCLVVTRITGPNARDNGVWLDVAEASVAFVPCPPRSATASHTSNVL
jgi:hypothetical protein